MTIQFRGAVRHRARARIALFGPSGAGKTMSALAIATGLVGEDEDNVSNPLIGDEVQRKVFVIDSERGSAEKFAFDPWRFSSLDMREVFEDFAPANYVKAIKAAEGAGAEVIIIDSLSHAWMGVGGALEMVDKAAMRSQSKNTYYAWRDVTPEHNKMIDAIINARAHIIATMRVKTEYIVEDKGGKQVPRKIGLAPIQRDGMEYEFDLVGDLDLDHNLIITKSRMRSFDGKVIPKPTAAFGRHIADWLSDGVDRPEPQTQEKPEAPLVIVRSLQARLGWDNDAVGQLVRDLHGKSAHWKELRPDQQLTVVAKMRNQVDAAENAALGTK